MESLSLVVSIIPLIALFGLFISLLRKDPVITLFMLIIVWVSCVFLWELPIENVIVLSVRGIYESVVPLWTVFGTLFFVFTLMKASVFDALTYYVHNLTPDIRLQSLLIGVFFASLLQSLFGYGIPVVVCALMLYALNFDKKHSIFISLLGTAFCSSFGSFSNGLSSSIGGLTSSNIFGAVFSSAESYISNVSIITGLLSYFVNMMFPLLALYFVTVRFNKCSIKDFKAMIPFTVTTSLIYLSSSTVLTYFVSYKLAAVIPSMLTILVSIYMIKNNIMIPDVAIRRKTDVEMDKPSISVFNMLFPFALFTIFSLILQIIEPLGEALKKVVIDFPAYPYLPGASFQLLTSPGTICFLFGLLMIYFYRLKLDDVEQITEKLTELLHNIAFQLVGICIVIVIFTSSFGGVEGSNSMSMYLSDQTGLFIGSLWGMISPFVAALGTLLTGGANMGDMLFARFQFDIAAISNLNTQIIGASQQLGSAVASVIGIFPIIIASEVLYESDAVKPTFKKGLAITVLSCSMIGILTMLLLYFV